MAIEQIGVYRIVRPLGQGGMGAVYEVVHEKLGVHYALKTFTLDHGHVDLLKERFLAEGRILARLHHPNLVRVFDLDFDVATQTLYFVMDLVLYKDGEPYTLADVEDGSADEKRVARWFGQLAAALDYIHGDEDLKELAGKDKAMGFLLPEISKKTFFKRLSTKGVYPRKTFSIGEAPEKRYYLESQKIK